METLQDQPLVSIVIPAYNEEKWISYCLESVLGNSYSNKEIIVVDDGSTDGTRDILKRFPVRAIRNEKPVGPSSARNIGVKEARGEIIIFIDAHCIANDDRWIEKFLEFFRDPEVGAVGGYFKRETLPANTSLTFKTDLQHRLIKSANAAYRKATFEQVGGFDPDIEWGGDAALTYKVRRSKWKIVHSRDIIVVHAKKIWSIKRAFYYGACYFALLTKYPNEKGADKEIKPVPFFLSTHKMELCLTLGLITDLLLRFPIFTPSLLIFSSILRRGPDRDTSMVRKLKDGLYTTIWNYSYFLGAVFGGAKNLLIRKKQYETHQTLLDTSFYGVPVSSEDDDSSRKKDH